jgi:hypothetical protein
VEKFDVSTRPQWEMFYCAFRVQNETFGLVVDFAMGRERLIHASKGHCIFPCYYLLVHNLWDRNVCLKISYWLPAVGFMCICWPTIGRYGIVKRWCSYLTTTSSQLMSGQTEMWTFYVNLHWSKTSNISMISRISAILRLFSPHHL